MDLKVGLKIHPRKSFCISKQDGFYLYHDEICTIRKYKDTQVLIKTLKDKYPNILKSKWLDIKLFHFVSDVQEYYKGDKVILQDPYATVNKEEYLFPYQGQQVTIRATHPNFLDQYSIITNDKKCCVWVYASALRRPIKKDLPSWF